MQKYKICPSCQTKNEPTLLECIHCEADLTRIKITDEETEEMRKENAASQIDDTPRAILIRVCDCGTKNLANARKCHACGEDISDITPTADSEVEQDQKAEPSDFVLSSLDGQYAYKFTADEETVGRENAMSEYLASKRYVSRAHAKIIAENGALYIQNLSNTNHTYVNNQRIEEKTKLSNGDEIGLGGTSINGQRQTEAAYFLVRINACM